MCEIGTAIAGQDVDVSHLGALAELPNDGVLAATAAHDHHCVLLQFSFHLCDL
jgi:hypothetical protein